MARFFVKNRLFVSYRVNFDTFKYPSAPTMLQQDDTIAKTAETYGAIVVKDFLDIDEISSVKLLCQAIIYTKEKNGVLILSFSDSILNSCSHIKEIVNAKIDFLFCDKPQINNELLAKTLKTFLENKKGKLPAHLKKLFELNQELRKQLHEYELAGNKIYAGRTRSKILSLAIGRQDYYSNEGRIKGGQVRRMVAQQDESNKKAFEIVNRMMLEAAPLTVIAETLNMAGYRSSRGCKYYPTSIKNLINLYRPIRLGNTPSVIKDRIDERLYNELLNDKEAYKDIHEKI